LAIGTADQVLSVGTAGVPTWSTPTSGALTHISSTTVGTATQTVTLSSIPQGYSALRVVIRDLYSSTTTGTQMAIYVNDIRTSTYGHQYVKGVQSTASAERATDDSSLFDVGRNFLVPSTGKVGTFMTIDFYNYSNTTKAKYGSAAQVYQGSTSNLVSAVALSGFMSAGTAAITSLVFESDSATNLIAAGSRFDVYGVS
jgi:hypothetical protein